MLGAPPKLPILHEQVHEPIHFLHYVDEPCIFYFGFPIERCLRQLQHWGRAAQSVLRCGGLLQHIHILPSVFGPDFVRGAWLRLVLTGCDVTLAALPNCVVADQAQLPKVQDHSIQLESRVHH